MSKYLAIGYYMNLEFCISETAKQFIVLGTNAGNEKYTSILPKERYSTLESVIQSYMKDYPDIVFSNDTPEKYNNAMAVYNEHVAVRKEQDLVKQMINFVDENIIHKITNAMSIGLCFNRITNTELIETMYNRIDNLKKELNGILKDIESIMQK